jgi:prepilin-type N-terminal cleavage/methylation domain-containing protein
VVWSSYLAAQYDQLAFPERMTIPVLPPSKVLKTTNGFSLVELLMVVGIIAYRARAADSQMKTDLKNAAVAMESYYAEYRAYPASVTAIAGVGFSQTSGVGMVISVTSPSTFTLTASTSNGSQPSFTYTSTTGAID